MELHRRQRCDSSPAAVNGVLYVGSTDNQIYALNAKTGVELWSFTTRSAVPASPGSQRCGLRHHGRRDCFCRERQHRDSLVDSHWSWHRIFFAGRGQWPPLRRFGGAGFCVCLQRPRLARFTVGVGLGLTWRGGDPHHHPSLLVNLAESLPLLPTRGIRLSITKNKRAAELFASDRLLARVLFHRSDR